MMKVLLVSFSDMEGGAARATYRLQKGLQMIGVNSQILVKSKRSDDHNVISSQNTGFTLRKFRGYFLQNGCQIPCLPKLPRSNQM
jgi:hypothetical protein